MAKRYGKPWDKQPHELTSFVTICALLEEKGYRRHEIGEMTDWYVLRVLQHPRDNKGRLIWGQHDRQVRRLDWEEQVAALMRRRGVPEHQIKYAVEDARREAEYRAARRKVLADAQREKRRKEAREAAEKKRGS